MWHKIAGFEIANVVVKKAGATAVFGTDYDLDTELGAVKPLSGGMFSVSDVMALTFDLTSISTVEYQTRNTHRLHLRRVLSLHGAPAERRSRDRTGLAPPHGQIRLEPAG